MQDWLSLAGFYARFIHCCHAGAAGEGYPLRRRGGIKAIGRVKQCWRVEEEAIERSWSGSGAPARSSPANLGAS